MPEGRPTLYLDLDLTLVLAVPDQNWKCLPEAAFAKADFSIEVSGATKDRAQGSERYTVFLRPGVREFLEAVSESYEMVVFTAATSEYADKIIDALEGPKRVFSHRLYRNHCRELPGKDGNTILVKDIRCVRDRNMETSVLVDDNPTHITANPGRSI